MSGQTPSEACCEITMPKKIRTRCYVRSNMNSKQIEQESLGWSGFLTNSKPDQPGPSNFIYQEVILEQT